LYTWSIPLDPGKYSDVGYRLRANLFNNHDDWYPFAADVQGYKLPSLFFDFKYFNFDTYDVDKN